MVLLLALPSSLPLPSPYLSPLPVSLHLSSSLQGRGEMTCSEWLELRRGGRSGELRPLLTTLSWITDMNTTLQAGQLWLLTHISD
jgi:hypothetical protein